MTNSDDRITAEREFHDRQATARIVYFAANQSELMVDDETFLRHEPWILPAIHAMGDIRGKVILDYGCGHGMAAVVLARRGATVVGFDLSPVYCAEARTRAAVNGVSLHLVAADGHHLPFADAAFDGIFGNAILHHLDLGVAGTELRRVLKPGAVAVFCEPVGNNPLLNYARNRLPYRGKERTKDEAPLTWAQIKSLRRPFPGIKVKGYQLFSMVRRAWGDGFWVRVLTGVDWAVLGCLPFLQRYCRYAVITLR